MAQELPTVRAATPDDEPALMGMCRRLHLENGLCSFDEEKVRGVIQRAVNYVRKDDDKDKRLFIIGVIGPPWAIEASICLFVTSFYYTLDSHVTELWNFVDEPFRNSRNAAALVDFSRRSAEYAGLPLFIGVVTNKQMAGKVRLYRRLLGQPAGAFFVANSKWKSEPMEDHTELRRQLKEFADTCTKSPRTITFDVAQKKVGPLLRAAADAVQGEDSMWGPVRPKANGGSSAKQA